MLNKIQATESDIIEQNKVITPMIGENELDTKMMYLAQEMDLFNQRLELIEKGMDAILEALQSHRHATSGEAMFPFQKA